jgi:hypothetical protein
MSDQMTVAEAQALMAKKSAGRLTEPALRAKYPHVVEGTLGWDAGQGKQVVEIACACGEVRRVATSDLFQVRSCAACAKAERKARKAAKRAKVDALIAKAKAVLAAQPVEA